MVCVCVCVSGGLGWVFWVWVRCTIHDVCCLYSFRYQINCICCDEFTDQSNTTWKQKVYEADAKQLLDAGFHGVKLDDCGDGTGAGLLQRVAAINASGKALLIENSKGTNRVIDSYIYIYIYIYITIIIVYGRGKPHQFPPSGLHSRMTLHVFNLC